MEQPNPQDFPKLTPNVVLENPVVRRVLGWVLGIVAIVLPVSIAVDAATEAFDLSQYTQPFMAGYLVLLGLYNLIVTQPNIPRG